MFLLFLFICIVFSNEVDEIDCFTLKNHDEIDSNGIMTINKEGRMCDCEMNWYDEISINIKKIIIGENVENIGNVCFYGMEELTEIDFGNVKEIGEWSFSKSE